MILAGAALLALAACNKFEVVTTEGPANEIAFKAITNIATKANPQLEGTTLGTDDSYKMFVSATSRNANGEIENASFFEGVEFTYKASPAVAWVSATPYYWPLGGGSVDFLAYAVAASKASSVTPTWKDAADNSAGKVVFSNVAVTTNGVDLMYAATNAAKGTLNPNESTAKTVALVFNHAGAVIDINITANQAATINSVKFGNLTKDATNLADRKYTSLDEQATLTIDNTRNILDASWDASQPTNVAYTSLFTFPNSFGTLTADTQKSVDDIIVIPQPKLNFIINYTMNGNTMTVTSNQLKGNWLAGHKYVYNITLSLYEIQITETVVDYLDYTETEAQTII